MKLAFRKRAAGQREANSVVVAAPNENAPHFGLGRRGEALALDYLRHVGYRIVAANFSIPIGRNTREVTVNAEIDLVAYDGSTLCFVEVKTRASDEFAPPQVNVDRRKQRQITRAARGYRRMFGLMGSPYRYDVVTVVLPASERQIHAGPRIELLKNFWTDERLRKRNWYDARWD
jgi:putative endonuclease